MAISLKKIFILSILVRIFIMPFFYHPDIKSQHFHFQFLSSGVSDIYSHLQINRAYLPNTDTFNYLPLTYFFFGTTHTLSKTVLPQLTPWVNNWGPQKDSDPVMPAALFILKIPYLIFDLLLGLLLYKIYSSRKILLFWLFNPLNLYLIYILGNFDIVPVTFTFLSFYFLRRHQLALSGLALGIAVAFKAYPLLILPFFLFYYPFSLKKFITYLIAFSLPLALTVIPFFGNTHFWSSFFGSGLTQKLLQSQILTIPVFPVLYLLIFMDYLFSRHSLRLEKSIFYLFLIFVGLVNIHPQWLLWFAPLFIAYVLKTKKSFISYCLIILFSLVYVFLINDRYLFWGHLIPIDPDFITLPSPHQLLKDKFFINPYLWQNYVHYLIMITGLGFIIYDRRH